MFGAGDEIILKIAGEFGEIGAVSGDADDQSLVAVRLVLRGNESFPVDDVELEMPQLEVADGGSLPPLPGTWART